MSRSRSIADWLTGQKPTPTTPKIVTRQQELLGPGSGPDTRRRSDRRLRPHALVATSAQTDKGKRRAANKRARSARRANRAR